ncbi:unnamed protein product [Citrullus colocynthis]|uniref:Uncharacterized protein n=1 Tax=Citrullus colocynthis TaxID=252529 RepID=A0ABP0YPP7_9ROSI
MHSSFSFISLSCKQEYGCHFNLLAGRHESTTDLINLVMWLVSFSHVCVYVLCTFLCTFSLSQVSRCDSLEVEMERTELTPNCRISLSQL